MVSSKAVNELQKTLTDLINAHLESDTMSMAELIGVLEMAILDVFLNSYTEEDDDTEE